MAERTRKEKTVWFLSLAGFLPFAFLAIVLLVLGKQHAIFSPLFDIFKTWSVVILSFLAGTRWGLTLGADDTGYRNLVLATLLALAGWLSLLFPGPISVLVLLLAFCAMGAWDSFAANGGVIPQWYGRMRIWLTLLVAVAHILVFFAIV